MIEDAIWTPHVATPPMGNAAGIVVMGATTEEQHTTTDKNLLILETNADAALAW